MLVLQQSKLQQAFLLALLLTLAPWPAMAGGPAVVPTAEGQIGETPGADDKVFGTRFESIRGQAGDLVFGGIFVPGGMLPPPPEMNFLTDRIHDTPNPVQVGATASLFSAVTKESPASSRTRNGADDGDFVAFSFAVDGAMPQTLSVRIATFDETGASLINVPLADVGTTPFPDPSFSKTGVAVDNQGRVTVAYTELTMLGTARILGDRIDAITGLPIGGGLVFNSDGNHTSPDIALLDPAGNRLLIATNEFSNPAEIKGNIVDFSGPTPQVLPEFPISTTSALFGNFLPSVAANSTTGEFTVAWEHVTAVQGDPIDVRARRFDAMGNPIGGDFRVNTTTANSQAQPAAAYGQGGESVIVWAGDAAVMQDELDVFAQVYDAMGNPIGGEIRVNTTTVGVQDKPAVRFLPEPDARGQPQFVVAWRDVGNADGSMPNGTGTSYRCFSIGEDPSAIFTDGFESGDTTSWSDENP